MTACALARGLRGDGSGQRGAGGGACSPFATARLARFPQIPVHAAGSVLIAGGVALTGVADSVVGYALVGGRLVGRRGVRVRDRLRDRRQPRPGARTRPLPGSAFQWTWGVSRFAALTVGVALYTGIGPAVLSCGRRCSVVSSAPLAPFALAGRITRRMEHELAA